MYNGIGLSTARGTGTNGYVQKNLSFVPQKRERVEYVKDVEMKKLETLIEKKGNAEILEHEKKRRIELKCLEMREMMLNTGYDEEVTNQKVQTFRKLLVEREGLFEKSSVEYDEFGRPIAKETHQLAQANDEKNRRLREAFGIGEFNKKEIQKQKVEEAKEEERKKAELASKQYAIVEEKVPDEVEEEVVEKKEKKHRHHKSSREEKKRKSSPSDSKEKSSRKHSKKHRHHSSDSDEDSARRHRDRSSKH